LIAAPINTNNKHLWQEALKACDECLRLDKDFVSNLQRKINLENEDPLDPVLWENFIKARQDLFEYTTQNLNVLSREKNIHDEGKKIREHLITSLDEMLSLEERLTVYLSDNLTVLKEAINDISKNQTIFSFYARQTPKPEPDHLSSLA
jgi:hypothetical protein